MSQSTALNALLSRDRFAFMRGNMLVLTVTGALGMLSRSMAFPYASLYILALGGSPEQIGLITALSPLAGLLVFPMGGYLTDRAGRVKLIAVGGYLSSAVLLLFVLSPNWQVLALATFLRGFMVFQFPPTSAIIADSLAPGNRAKGVATMNAISGGFALIAPYVAGAVLESRGDEVGMRALYGFMMAIYLISAIINHRFLRETSELKGSTINRSSLPSALREAYCCIPGLLRTLPTSAKALALIIVLGFVANGIASPYWVVYARDHIGLSTKSWGLILLVEMLLRNLLWIPAGVAIDRYGRAKFVRAALLVTAIAMPLYIAASGFTQVLLIRAVLGIANAFFLPACSAMMSNALPRSVRGSAMAALGRGTVMLGPSSGGTGGPGLGLLMVIPVMLSSLAGGYLYDRDPSFAWFTSVGAIALALIVAFGFLRDAERAEV